MTATRINTTKKKAATRRMAKKPRPERPTKTARSTATKARKKAAVKAIKRKPSTLDSAARVLAETGQPMSCRELVDAMAKKDYWKSPGGKTPHATLNSAIIREIATKGRSARFRRGERGRFAANG